MVRIKIKDLPRDRKISREEMKKVFGGYYFPAPMTPQTPQVSPNSWPSSEDLPSAYWQNPFSK